MTTIENARRVRLQTTLSAIDIRIPDREGGTLPNPGRPAIERAAMLAMVVLGFGGALLTGACVGEIGYLASGVDAPDSSTPPPNCPAPGVDPPAVESTSCPAPVEEPCERYRLELLGDPTNNPAVRAIYIGAFGDACYLAYNANRTFDCWYKTWEEACKEAVRIGEVSGNAPYDKGYTCQTLRAPSKIGVGARTNSPRVANSRTTLQPSCVSRSGRAPGRTESLRKRLRKRRDRMR